MSHRRLSIVLSLGLAACASEAPPVAPLTQPIWGGSTDADTREANAVVSISGCTGTLLTPRLVLSAAHCFDPGTLPTVQLGNDRDGFGGDHEVQAIRVLPYPGFHKGEDGVDHPPSLDAQLVWLERPVLDAAIIQRPSLAPPSDVNVGTIGMAGWSTCGPVIDESDPLLHTRQAVLWHDGVADGAGGPAPLALQNYPDAGGYLWKRDGSDVGVCFGDSGGPLFRERADASREVLGVLSLLWYDGESRRAIAAAWADVTREPLRSWILASVRDDAQAGGHSAAWRAAHGKDADFWYGEVDYTGACDVARDADCDHWYSEHDDQPTVYDPDQTEATPPPTRPCSDLCTSPVAISSPWYGSGSLGSSATCHETTLPVNGLACGGLVAPRVLRVNGQTIDCAHVTLPPARQGGYCLQTTAGAQDWAWFQLW